MSQPERYEPRARSICGPWKMVKCKNGAYVCFEQHEEIVAALTAEKEAENERLRKAGDLMAKHFEYLSEWNQNADGSPLIHPSLKAWRAAKEGGAK